MNQTYNQKFIQWNARSLWNAHCLLARLQGSNS
jgi:hypothetical protein